MMKENMKVVKDFSVEMYRRLARHSGTIFFEWDLILDKFFVSENVYDIYGAFVTKERFSEYLISSDDICPDDRHIVEDFLDVIYQKRQNITDLEYYGELECRLKAKDGSYVWSKAKILTLYDEDKEPYKIIGSFNNIDFKKRHQQELAMQAQRDSLTGLYNKGTSQRLILDYIEKKCDGQRKQAILMIDIDGFKSVNDYFGHLFGDAIITDFAICIKNNFRDPNIVGRVGGDEFLVLVKDLQSEEVLAETCAALLEQLSRTYISDHSEYKVSASIGIALYPDHGRDFTELFKQADCALYTAKETGKNQCVFYRSDQAIPKYISSRSNQTDDQVLAEQKSFQEHILEYMFKLLYQTKDIEATLKMILELLGKSFNLERIFIYEIGQGKPVFSVRYEWTADEAAVAQQIYRNPLLMKGIDILEKKTQYGLLSQCDDVTKLPDDQTAAFVEVNIAAFLHCKICSNGTGWGSIGFDCCKAKRRWTAQECETLSMVADILGVFFMKQAAIEESMQNQNKLQALVDRLPSWVYVINSQTFDILFLNERVKSFVGEDFAGKKCYEMIFDRDQPCENCIADRRNEICAEITREYYNEGRKRWFSVQESKIDWNKNGDAILLVASDITDYKGS